MIYFFLWLLIYRSIAGKDCVGQDLYCTIFFNETIIILYALMAYLSLIVGMYLFTIAVRKLANDYKLAEIDPREFTTLVKDIPEGTTVKDIKDYFQNKVMTLLPKTGKISRQRIGEVVHDVCFIYNSNHIQKLVKNRLKTDRRIKQLDKQLSNREGLIKVCKIKIMEADSELNPLEDRIKITKDPDTKKKLIRKKKSLEKIIYKKMKTQIKLENGIEKRTIEKEILIKKEKHLAEDIKKEEEEYNDKSKRAGRVTDSAFVTFNKIIYTKTCVQSRILISLGKLFGKPYTFTVLNTGNPNTIKWKNFGINRHNIRSYLFFLVFWVIFVILVCAILYGIKVSEDQFLDSYSLFSIQRILVGLFLQIFDAIYSFIFKKILKIRKFITSTKEESSFLNYFMISRFFAFMVPEILSSLFLSVDSLEVIGYEILWQQIFSAIKNPIFTVVNFSSLSKWYMRSRIRKKVGYKIISHISQYDLNQYHSGLDFDLPGSYVDVLSNAIVVMFFAVISPFTPFVFFLELILLYVAKKYMVVFQSKEDRFEGVNFVYKVAFLFNFVPLANVLGLLIFSYMRGGKPIIFLVVMGIGVVLTLVQRGLIYAFKSLFLKEFAESADFETTMLDNRKIQLILKEHYHPDHYIRNKSIAQLKEEYGNDIIEDCLRRRRQTYSYKYHCVFQTNSYLQKTPNDKTPSNLIENFPDNNELIKNVLKKGVVEISKKNPQFSDEDPFYVDTVKDYKMEEDITQTTNWDDERMVFLGGVTSKLAIVPSDFFHEEKLIENNPSREVTTYLPSSKAKFDIYGVAIKKNNNNEDAGRNDMNNGGGHYNWPPNMPNNNHHNAPPPYNNYPQNNNENIPINQLVNQNNPLPPNNNVNPQNNNYMTNVEQQFQGNQN